MQRTERFHRIKRYIGRIAGILAALAICAGVIQLFNYLYVDASNDITRITWHDYYEHRGKIDNLYLGSSHVFSDVDPRLLDEMTGECNFDLATGRQPLNGTFYLLKEAGQDNKLSHVYVEMYYFTSTIDMEGNDPADAFFEYNAENINYMRPSVNKLAYILTTIKPDQYSYLFLPFSRYREKLGDWDYVKQTVEYKRGENYLNYQYHKDFTDGYLAFMGAGYFGSTRMVQDEGRIHQQERILEEDPMGNRSKEYVHKVIEYCQKREIPITFFVSPVDHLQLISTVNYDNYVNEMREITDAYGVPFYDFNLVRDEYLPIWQNEYFRDLGHLNMAGAEMFTRFLAQVTAAEETDNAPLFYTSYEEKLQALAPAVYGLYHTEPEKDPAKTAYRTLWIASNRSADMEYRIIMTPEEGEQYTVQDFNVNKEFIIPCEETGICTIVARMKEDPDEIVQTIEIKY